MKKKKVNVVVYGTLLSGESNAGWAGRAKRRECWISGRIYDTGYGYPAFVHQLVGDARVEAEMLETDEDGLAKMDILEGYPTLYTRKMIPCYSGEDAMQVCMAWVYVMNRLPDGAKLIKCGDWRCYRKGKELGLKAFIG